MLPLRVCVGVCLVDGEYALSIWNSVSTFRSLEMSNRGREASLRLRWRMKNVASALRRIMHPMTINAICQASRAGCGFGVFASLAVVLLGGEVGEVAV